PVERRDEIVVADDGQSDERVDTDDYVEEESAMLTSGRADERARELLDCWWCAIPFPLQLFGADDFLAPSAASAFLTASWRFPAKSCAKKRHHKVCNTRFLSNKRLENSSVTSRKPLTIFILPLLILLSQVLLQAHKIKGGNCSRLKVDVCNSFGGEHPCQRPPHIARSTLPHFVPRRKWHWQSGTSRGAPAPAAVR
ncbi:unnamed protein product, partial [Nesidiocoris tenuis]